MKTWVTSDLHFGHKNIMSFCPVTRARFRNDVAYMNEQMVIEWNAMIAPEDTVYILGDVAFLPAAKAAEYMMRCNGSKILIEGNQSSLIQVFQNLFRMPSTTEGYIHIYPIGFNV